MEETGPPVQPCPGGVCQAGAPCRDHRDGGATSRRRRLAARGRHLG